MSVFIGSYEFEGPKVSWQGVKEEAGVYAIMSFANHEFELVDVDEADDLQKELLNPKKHDYWQRKSNGMLTISVFYHPKASRGRRQEIVNEILREFTGDFAEEPENYKFPILLPIERLENSPILPYKG